MTDTTHDESTLGPRRSGLSLFRIAGTEIRIDYSWLFIFALILVSLSAGYFPRVDPDAPASSHWLAGLAGTLMFFASILIHELAHALVARAKGIQVPAITLFLFGGVSHLEDEARTPRSEFEIAVVGPLTSFALAALCWGGLSLLPDDTPRLLVGVVDYVAFMNAALGAFNLLPGFPLDGGRVLRAAVWWRTGSLRRGTRFAADVGKGLALGLMILGGLQIFFGAGLVGGLWLVLIGLFLRGMAETGYQNLVMQQALEDVTVEDVAIAGVQVVSPELSIQQFIDDALLAYGYRAFPVVDAERRVRGLISIADLKNLPAAEREVATVEQCMLPLSAAIRVEPDLPLDQALRKLAFAPGGRLLVMRGERLVGMLTKSRLTRSIEIRRALEESAPAGPTSGAGSHRPS